LRQAARWRCNLPKTMTGMAYNADNEQTKFGGNTFTYDLNGNLAADATST
jgi:hypothetical protein